jgi:hypothetical protein
MCADTYNPLSVISWDTDIIKHLKTGEINLAYDYKCGCNSGCMWSTELKFS